MSMTMREFQAFVKSIAGRLPSPSAILKWVRKDRTIRYTVAKGLEYERQSTGTSSISDFYATVQADIPDIRNIPPQLQLNTDEMKMKSEPKKEKVFSIKEDFEGTGKKAQRLKNKNISWHGTCVITSSPMPDFPINKVPPIFISPHVEVPPDLEATNSRFDLFRFFLAGTPKSGWIRTEILLEYAKRFVIPFFKEQRLKLGLTETATAIWWLDGDDTRRSAELIDLCRQNHVHVIIFPAGSTSGIQPNDNGIIGAIQQKTRSKMKDGYRRKGAVEERFIVINALHSAIAQSLSDHQISAKAWEVSGVYPWNESVHYLDEESRNRISSLDAKRSVDKVVPTAGRKLPITSAVLTADPRIRDRVADEFDRNRPKREARQAKRGLKKKPQVTSSRGGGKKRSQKVRERFFIYSKSNILL